jgi:phage gp16-like protein
MSKIYREFFKGFSKVFKGPQDKGRVATIGGVKPNVPITKTEKAKSKLKIATQKTKASQAKLDQAIFNLQEQNRAFKKARENKANGGRIGRRFGGDTMKKKTNVEKIRETFAPKNKNLKPVDPKKQKGLSKLPRQVRNKMGYMKSGGRA